MRAIQIAAGNPGAANMDFAFGTDRQQLPGGIEQVAAQIREFAADRAARLFGIFGTQRQIGCMHGDFGDAVHVDQLRVTVARIAEPRFERGHFQGFATEHHLAQTVGGRAARLGCEQTAECARGLVEHRHALLAD